MDVISYHPIHGKSETNKFFISLPTRFLSKLFFVEMKLTCKFNFFKIYSSLYGVYSQILYIASGDNFFPQSLRNLNQPNFLSRSFGRSNSCLKLVLEAQPGTLQKFGIFAALFLLRIQYRLRYKPTEKFELVR